LSPFSLHPLSFPHNPFFFPASPAPHSISRTRPMIGAVKPCSRSLQTAGFACSSVDAVTPASVRRVRGTPCPSSSISSPPACHPERTRGISLHGPRSPNRASLPPIFRKHLSPFRMNTCESVSKQRTLTPFRMNTCGKRGRGYPIIVNHVSHHFPHGSPGAQAFPPVLPCPGSVGFARPVLRGILSTTRHSPLATSGRIHALLSRISLSEHWLPQLLLCFGVKVSGCFGIRDSPQSTWIPWGCDVSLGSSEDKDHALP